MQSQSYLIENQLSYIADKSSKNRYQQHSDSYFDRNNNSDNNDQKFFEQQMDQIDSQKQIQQQNQIIDGDSISEHSFNERLSEFDIDAQNDFESIYQDDNLNKSEIDYNNRDLDNNSFTKCNLEKRFQYSNKIFGNEGINTKEEDRFLNEVIRESEELQKQLRILDDYQVNQNGSIVKDKQFLNSSMDTTPKKIKKISFDQELERRFVQDVNRKDFLDLSPNQQSDQSFKCFSGLKENGQKNSLMLSQKGNKQIVDSNKKFNNQYKSNTDKLYNLSNILQLSDENYFNNTEPIDFSVQDQNSKQSSKRKQQENIIKSNDKMIKYYSPKKNIKETRQISKQNNEKQQNANCIYESAVFNSNIRDKKQKKSSLSRKDSSSQNSIQQSKNKSQIIQNNWKNQQINHLVIESDLNDNQKGDFYYKQNVKNGIQNFNSNEINQSYSPFNYQYSNGNDFTTVSNISTNHQFFQNKYLQDQVNLNDIDFKELNNLHSQNPSNMSQNNSIFSQVDHSQDQNIYKNENNSNNQSNQNFNYQYNPEIDLQQTGNFQILQQQFQSKEQNRNNDNNFENINKQIINDILMRNSNMRNQEQSYGVQLEKEKGQNRTNFSFNSSKQNQNKHKQNQLLNISTDNKQKQPFLTSKHSQNNLMFKKQDQNQDLASYSPNIAMPKKNMIQSSSCTTPLIKTNPHSLWDISSDEQCKKDNHMNLSELTLQEKKQQKKNIQQRYQTQFTNQTQQSKASVNLKKNKDVIKKISRSSSHKDVKNNQIKLKKCKDGLNSKTSLINTKNNVSLSNLNQQNSNENNIIYQLEILLDEKDQIIESLKQQNNEQKQKIQLYEKSQKECGQNHQTSQYNQQYQNTIHDQLNISKRFQEANKILIDKIKELNTIKNNQSEIIEQKSLQYKNLSQKYNLLKRALKNRIKINNDLKKENEMIKQLKFNNNMQQNIDYNQLLKAFQQISQINDNNRDQLQNIEREEISRATFCTQRSSALGDYLTENRENQIQGTKKENETMQKSKQNQSTQRLKNEQYNYYNQSMNSIKQNSNTMINNDSYVSNKKLTTTKPNSTTQNKVNKIQKAKQTK